MEDKCLFDFDKNDKLLNYKFESEWIKQFSFEREDTSIFTFKQKLSISRKSEKDKLVFIVQQDFFYKEEEFNCFDDVKFKDEKSAIEFFISQVEEMNFLSEKSKENIVFDGRRYFWKINENNEVTERVC